MLLVNYLGFPDSSAGKESACNAEDPGVIPGSGRSAGEGTGYPLQYSWASAGEESACNAGDPSSVPGSRKICWRRNRLPTPVFLGFPGGSVGKESTFNAGDLG